MIQLKIVTVLVRTGEGTYSTYSSSVFKGKSYTEGSIETFLADAPGYLAPGAIIVPVTCSKAVFRTLLDQQRGDDAVGQDTVEISIFEGSVIDLDTDEPIDPTTWEE